MTCVGIKRIVDTAFWTDGKVDDFSPEDKYFMLYLLTNPFSTQLGIYEISIKQVAFQMGYSTDAVKVLIERFENKYGIILFSQHTNEIAIKNFLRHSIVKGGAPVRDCLIKEIKNVKNKALVAHVFSHIKNSESLNETVKNIIAEYEEQNGALSYSNEKQNDNENENENDVSLPYRQRFVDESQFEQIKNEIVNNTDKEHTCEWCGNKTSILHKHHFPIPKRQGGKEIVSICPTCHFEFHSKEREMMGGSFIELEQNNTQKTPYQQIVDLFNSICVSLPSVRSLSETRKKAIKARLNTYTIEDFKQCFENAEASSFLKGSNNRNWTATFDWLIKDANMAKVIEGNYADKSQGFSSFDTDEFYRAALERSAMKRMEENQKNPPKTAAEDDTIRERMEALKEQLQ